MFAEIVRENIGKTCSEIRKFLQEMVGRGELKAYLAEEHPQRTEYTEDEIIIRIRIGLLLTPTENLKEYYAFVENPKSGYLYNVHFGYPMGLCEANYHVTTLVRLIKNFNLKKMQTEPFEDAKVVIPEEMISARLTVEYLANRQKVEWEWKNENPEDEDNPFHPNSLIIEGEKDELFTKILEFVRRE